MIERSMTKLKLQALQDEEQGEQVEMRVDGNRTAIRIIESGSERRLRWIGLQFNSVGDAGSFDRALHSSSVSLHLLFVLLFVSLSDAAVDSNGLP
jgi:hypothetical protein